MLNFNNDSYFCLSVELIADMYENAHKARTDSEEVLSALFMSYVRLGDYKRQQQTAMLLHKLKPNKNPYYFWAVMSLVMQVRFLYRFSDATWRYASFT